uniref:HN1-like protein n=1 Tax=Ictalurus punctatus TaxID=7998 RepID=Q6UVH3_ICTPU|nr:HN1-like protein [Ictalurus punctatus]AAQ75761.1 HN1-like protein [Ictalurus punctatus]
MTSTNTFQGLEDGAKPSSRVLRPPGGGSSNIFGGYEDDGGASRRPNKMASTIFGPPEESQGGPKRSNPPGGKSSGIFAEPHAFLPETSALASERRANNIFGGQDSNLPTVKSHPTNQRTT